MKRKSNQKTALIAYMRVSTVEQGSSRLGLEAQREAIRRYAEQNDLVIFAEIEEVVSTRKERPQFEAALQLCEQFGYTLAVARLDRLSRDLLTIAQLQKSGVDFVAVDMPGASKFMVQILAAVAENERDMISERTKAALARAKANGTRLGAPDPIANVSSVIYDRAAAAEEFRAQLRPEVAEMRRNGMTLQAIADDLNRRSIPTPSGKSHWCPMKVSNVLKVPNGLNLAPASDAGDDQPAANDDLALFEAANRL